MASPTTRKKAGSAPARSASAKAAKPSAAKSVASSPAKALPKSMPAKPQAKSRSNAKSRSQRHEFAPSDPRPVSRALMAFDDDDVLPSGGSGSVGYGRCGGRMLSSQVERLLCDLLSREGVAHSHSPRHFEIKLPDGAMAAYAPMIVVRGRGREGKTIVIEALDQIEAGLLDKVRAFRKLYGLEFYVSFVGSEELLDEVPVDAYDESTVVQNVAALVSRLAD